MAVRPIDAVQVLKDINWHHKPTPVSEFESGVNQGLNQAMWIITHAPTLTPPKEPERVGLYGKYTVYKNKDGSLVTDCFILRPAKDPAAVAALRAYAAATDNAELSADIINWIGAEPNEWVSVEDELPENNTQVLMWSARWKIAEAGSYYNQHFWVYSEIGDGYIADNITHWAPLPAPPDRRPLERQEDTQ